MQPGAVQMFLKSRLFFAEFFSDKFTALHLAFYPYESPGSIDQKTGKMKEKNNA